MADHAGKKRSRRAKASGRKGAPNGPTLYIAKKRAYIEAAQTRVAAAGKLQAAGTLALDNAKIFEVIPFP